MKKSIGRLGSYMTAALALLLAAGCPKPPLPANANPPEKPGWTLVFHDEFDDLILNTDLWMTGFPWGRCNEIAFNTEEGNIACGDGVLRITARKEPITGLCFAWDDEGTFTPFYKDFEYSTGMLYSIRSFQYGYFECRFQVPQGKGFNSAFWLYGPEASEVDIFELVSSDNGAAQMTLHWKTKDALVGTAQWPTHIQPAGPAFDEGYHTFAVEWSPNDIVWYLDNWRVPESCWTKFIRNRHIPTVEMNVILTLGVGGMDGDPDPATPFPADFLVDYVRVYQTPQSTTQ